MLAAAACRSPERAAREAAAAPPPASAAGPLRILGIRPAPGASVEPRVTFLVQLDRPVAPATAVSKNINCYYPDPRAELIGDPFRLTAVWLDRGGTVVAVQPPSLLVGRDVRLLIGTGLRGADGSELPQDPALPPGLARLVEYRVLELPEP